jgi:hypothetical protein
MEKRRFRPSPAMVVACVALFVALGGTGLAASYVVSSNSQVGPNTISGHQAPSGDHANVISRSLNLQDLAPQSVNSAKVVNGSLVAGDTNTASVQRRVSGSCPSGQAAQSVTQTGGLDCGLTNGGTPGGSAGGDLSGTYPNPSLGSGVVGASALKPLGSVFDDTAPVQAVPFVVNSHFFSGTIGAGTSVDDVIYNGDAPTSFQIIDAWIVYQDPSGCSGPCTWQLRSATGGGGDAIIPSQTIPTGPGAVNQGDITRIDTFGSPSLEQTIPVGGTLVLRFTNPGPGTGSDGFDLHLLAVPGS